MRTTILIAAFFIIPINAVGQDFAAGLAAAQKGDFATALQEWKPLAEEGSATAQYNLGVMYAKGEGVPQDETEAARWYLLAAAQGSISAQVNLGFMYDEGRGVAQDVAEAIKWYRQAAEQGSTAAQLNLGFIYDEGRGGVPQDDAEAVQWYRQAAELGSATAQLNLGYMYRNGQGVPQDDAEAIKWYRLAAAQGNPVAQSNLGYMYRNGEGVIRDDAAALRWYRLAAAQGDAFAKTQLDRVSDEQDIVPQNTDEVVETISFATATVEALQSSFVSFFQVWKEPWLTLISFFAFISLALIGAAYASTRSLRLMRGDIASMQLAIHDLRQFMVSIPSLNIDGCSEDKITTDDVTHVAQHATLARQTNPLTHNDEPAGSELPVPIEAPIAVDKSVETEANGALDIFDLVQALDFPDDEHDLIGFAALRRAITDHNVLHLLQASHVVLTLLSEDDIYAENLPTPEISADVWRRFAQGSHGDQFDRTEVTYDPVLLSLVRHRVDTDKGFHEAAQLFIRRFGQMLNAFEGRATDTELLEMARTRSACCFMFLSQCTSVFADEVVG